MRIISLLSLFVLFSTYSFSQDIPQEELSIKLKRALSMKKTGQGLTIAGSIFVVGGFIIFTQGYNDHEYHLFPTDEENDANDRADTKMLIGYAGMLVGAASLGTGISFWIVGGTKSNRYRKLLNERTKDLSLGIDNRGVGLHLRF